MDRGDRARTAIAARSTRSAAARCRTRCCRPSTPRTATSPASAAPRSNTPLQALTTLNETARRWSARAGAGAAGPRATAARPTPSGSTYAFRRCVSRAADRRRAARSCSSCSTKQRRAVRRRLDATPGSSSTGKAERPTSLPAGVDARRSSAAWTVVAARAAEPGRDDHQGMSRPSGRMTRSERPAILACETPHADRSPLVPQGVRRRPRRRSRSAQLLGATALGRAPRRRRPIRSRRSSRTSPPKAKRVIFLFMAGAPSHLELFDNKPRAGEVRRHSCRRRSCSRATAPRSSTRTRSCSGRSSSSPSTASAARSCRELLPHLGEVVDDIAIVKSMAHRRVQPRAGADLDEHRLAAVRPAEHGRVDDLRPGQRVAGPARLRRLQHRQQGPERRRRATGAAASCRPSTRACRSAAAATRCCTSRTRAASTPSCSATRSTPSAT